MANTNSSTYSPGAAWNTLLQPFYVLSTVIGILIGTSILALALRGCARRRAARRRFVRAVDNGWAIPIFNVSEDTNVNTAAKNANGPKPSMRESVLDLNGGVHADGELWAKALPLSLTLLPTPTSRPHDLLLYLLRSPSILTSNLFSRLRAIQFVRSNQTQYHRRFLPPSDSHRNPEQQSASHKTSMSSTNSKERPSEGTATEPVQVMFVIAMPASPPPLRPRISPATAHEPAIPIANQELCVGVVSASLKVPVQYLNGPREDQAAAIRHGNMPELAEEEEGNYASTIHSRRVRSEDPGHGYARSLVSSRHMYVGNYGDEESSYMPHRSASASPSYWEDHGGVTGGGGGGSTHETHNSYLVPPSFGYRPSIQGHGRDDFSLVEIQQHQAQNDQARSGDSFDYPPSRGYTPSVVSANVPPPTDASAPPPTSSISPPLPTQPRFLISDPEPSPATTGDRASHQSHGADVEHSGLAANRVSQFTSTTDTTASATDVEGGYDADADAGRRLSLKPRGAARRRAGSK